MGSAVRFIIGTPFLDQRLFSLSVRVDRRPPLPVQWRSITIVPVEAGEHIVACDATLLLRHQARTKVDVADGTVVDLTYSPPYSNLGSGTLRIVGTWAFPTALPGWYADPAGGDGLRWWDGRTWTDATASPQPTSAVL